MAINSFRSETSPLLPELTPEKTTEEAPFQPINSSLVHYTSRETVLPQELSLAGRVSAATVDLFQEEDKTPRGSSLDFFVAESSSSTPSCTEEMNVEDMYFSHVPSAPPSPAPKKDTRNVHWNTRSLVVLIPTKEEYYRARAIGITRLEEEMSLPKTSPDITLGDMIWWTEDDFNMFKSNAIIEIRPLLTHLRAQKENQSLTQQELLKKAVNMLADL